MAKSVIQVGGMSCEHCVKAVTKAVSALPGVFSVAVDLKGKNALVDFDPAAVSLDKIKSEIEEQGYETN